ncbi:prepilin-type N-terminal cleavage/methylation domain-containing protein [Synoicihabitans lomoniglobus]|uniref:Prepilin-type N-terminal cleavage/methylation domain-containing protein n=3 Tax=Synoicihabitans lomoniglobus TaxID=2909285 RepID=A0AAE9ZWC6_9BACT|nr:prepilin-type N-terminal cleavage/methylation domain-containing protein [Opitutaceae bacterium LMO-M01]
MVTKAQSSSKRARGFTLVEVMIAASLAGVITLGVISSLTYLGRNLVRVANNSDLQTRAAVASATMQKDVGNATTVTSISSTSVTMTIDNNGTAESITYAFDSGAGEVIRTGPSHSYTVLRNVQSCSFTFSDADSAVTTNPTAVRKIEVDARTATGVANVGTYVTYEIVTPAMIVATSSL